MILNLVGIIILIVALIVIFVLKSALIVLFRVVPTITYFYNFIYTKNKKSSESGRFSKRTKFFFNDFHEEVESDFHINKNIDIYGFNAKNCYELNYKKKLAKNEYL
ncbi:unnamed protein product [Musa banksii]